MNDKVYIKLSGSGGPMYLRLDLLLAFFTCEGQNGGTSIVIGVSPETRLWIPGSVDDVNDAIREATGRR